MCFPLFFLPAPGWRMGPGGAVVFCFFCFFPFFFFSLCPLSVCLRGSRERERCGKQPGVRGWFEENETPSPLLPRSGDERVTRSRLLSARAAASSWLPGRGRRVYAPARLRVPEAGWGARHWAPTYPGLDAELSRCGERSGAQPLPLHHAPAACPRGPAPQ